MIKQILISLFLTLPYFITAQCSLADYQRIVKEAKTAQNKKAYDLAITKLNSARVCRPEKEDEVNKLILDVYAEIKVQKDLALKSAKESDKQKNIALTEREKADKRFKENYIKDLTYNSKKALINGDMNTAFRILEFAYKYVDKENNSLIQSLFDVLYYNDLNETKPLPRLYSLEGHVDEVTCVTFSPDGKRMASASMDNTIKIWDLDTHKAIQTLECRDNPQNCIVFLSNGSRQGVISNEMHGQKWRSDEGVDELKMNIKTPIVSLEYSPDGKYLAFGSIDGTAKIWDLEAAKIKFVLSGHQGTVNSVSFSRDGSRLATGSDDKTAMIWDTKSGKLLYTLKGHRKEINCVRFSPFDDFANRSRLATGSEDNTIKIWDENGKNIMTLEGHDAGVNSLDFIPYGDQLMSSSNDNILKTWDLNTGKNTNTMPGNTGYRSRFSSFFSELLALIPENESTKVLLWGLRNNEPILKFEAHEEGVKTLIFSPDEGHLATLGLDNNCIKVWDLNYNKNDLSLKTGGEVSFSRDGNSLAIGDHELIKILDLKTHKIIRTIKDCEKNYGCNIQCIQYSPDGKLIATGSNKSIKVWNADNGMIKFSANPCDVPGEDYDCTIMNIDFSPDSKKILCESDHYYKWRVWDIETGKPGQPSLSPQENWGHCYSSNGKFSINISDGYTEIMDTKSNTVFKKINSIPKSLSSVAFSPDCKTIAIGSGDDTKIFEIKSGKQILAINSSGSVLFSPDGKCLAVEGNIYIIDCDSLLRLWHQTLSQATITLSQLESNNLVSLFDFDQINETKIINSGDVWQIKAFADLVSKKGSMDNDLSTAEFDFSRAERLYAATLALQEEKLIRIDFANMLRKWASQYTNPEQITKFIQLEVKADKIWKEDNTLEPASTRH